MEHSYSFFAHEKPYPNDETQATVDRNSNYLVIARPHYYYTYHTRSSYIILCSCRTEATYIATRTLTFVCTTVQTVANLLYSTFYIAHYFIQLKLFYIAIKHFYIGSHSCCLVTFMYT